MYHICVFYALSYLPDIPHPQHRRRKSEAAVLQDLPLHLCNNLAQRNRNSRKFGRGLFLGMYSDEFSIRETLELKASRGHALAEV
jgi:hypothetical protein